MPHVNNLTNAQLERLAYLAEEMSEAGQIIGKIIRHGYDSFDPTIKQSPTNRFMLMRELSDVLKAMEMLIDANDLYFYVINEFSAKKSSSEYMHYQSK